MKGLFFILFLFISSIYCFSSGNKETASVTQPNPDPASAMEIGYYYYDNDDYENAVNHLIYAAENGISDGILYYRIAYTGEQLYGLTENVKNLYQESFNLLVLQYPKSRYRDYAFNKIMSFNDYPPLSVPVQPPIRKSSDKIYTIYKSVDRNKSGSIDLHEILIFQERLQKDLEYIHNHSCPKQS